MAKWAIYKEYGNTWTTLSVHTGKAAGEKALDELCKDMPRYVKTKDDYYGISYLYEDLRSRKSIYRLDTYPIPRSPRGKTAIIKPLTK